MKTLKVSHVSTGQLNKHPNSCWEWMWHGNSPENKTKQRCPQHTNLFHRNSLFSHKHMPLTQLVSSTPLT